jgi:hypothetical protein
MLLTRTLEVFAVNKWYMISAGAAFAIIALIMFFSTPALAAFVQNGGMESVSQKSTSFCAKFLITGCGEGSMNVWKPDVWNTFFGSHDLGQSWNDAHAGSWSVAIWWQPPSSCGWNTSTGTCGETTEGYDGNLVQHDITLSSTPATVSFWAKKCPFRPIQCNAWNCDGTQYYGTNETNLGRFMFQMTDMNTSQSVGSFPFDATDSWRKYSVSLSGNTSHMFNIYWQTLALSSTQVQPNCVLFDDFDITYGTGQASPAIAYISDMVNKTNFPYDGGAGITTLEISKHFQNVPLINFAWQSSGYSGCLLGAYYTGTCSPTIKIGYTNGNVVDVTSFSTVSHSCFGSNQCQNGGVMPLLDYTNVKNVTVSSTHGGTYSFNLTSNLTVRSTYGNLLDGYEDIHANPNLFPVIIYDTYLTPSGNLTFKAWNFKNSESVTNNLMFTLLGSGGSVIDTTSGTYTFPNGMSSWGQAAFTGEYAGAEAVNITFKSSSASLLGIGTWTYMPLTGAAVSCTSGCDGTTYIESQYSNGACISNYLVNDTRCTEVVPITPILNTTFNFEQPLFGDQGAFTPLTVPWVWFVIGALIAGIVALYFTSSFEISAIVIFTLLAAFTALGIMPLWLGIGIVVVIIAAIVYVVSKVIPIGGGGGGV